MDSNNKSFMEKVATVIVDKRKIIFLIFIAALLFCAVSSNWVQVNDDIALYLPEDTETRRGMDIMEKEFVTYSTADVMVENISYEQAEHLLDVIENTEGVKSVEFDNTERHYKSASALFKVTFDGLEDDEVSINALAELKEKLKDYDLRVGSQVGNPLKIIINKEMFIVDIIAFFIVITVLLFTSNTYGEIPVLLITFGAAALLNMGTNYMMGPISFVTNSIAIVLQLALAIDYAIILCHRFTEERADKDAREAAISALSKAIPEISASSLTTVSGLLALTFMQFKLGADMGLVLIKAILLSLCSVFFLLPGLLVLFSPLIDRTHHKSFVPKVSFLGKFAYVTRYIMPVIFVAIAVTAAVLSHKANYVYEQASVKSYRQNEEQIAEASIAELFGKDNIMAVLVPAGDYQEEAGLIKDLEDLGRVEKVLGLANIEAKDGYYITDALNPREFSELTNLDYEVASVLYTGYAMSLDDYGQVVTNLENYSVPLMDMFGYLSEKRDEVALNLPEDMEDSLNDLEAQLNDGKLQLQSKDWSRIVVTLSLPKEGKESFDYLDIVRGVVARHYDKFYVIGDTTCCSDLKDSFEKDNILISVLTILFVITVLIFSFRSVGLPLLLIMIIQGSIWCNFSRPYLMHENLFFITYLIISAIQMGANIDYAIVISSRYLEFKEKMPLKEAMIETLNHAFPTVVTSGSMLSLAGLAIALMTSNETISAIGVYLGVGTFISMILVLCILPQILLMGDIIISKTSFTLKKSDKVTRKVGVMRINGHVKGRLDGYIDADIHGIFKGDITAIIDMGGLEDVQDPLLESAEEGAEKNEKSQEDDE